MDPDLTWREMLKAVANREWEEARERAEALLEWLHKRGYPPITHSEPKLPKSWHHSMAYFACHLVLGWEKKRQR
jgi:hypothetical protein